MVTFQHQKHSCLQPQQRRAAAVAKVQQGPWPTRDYGVQQHSARFAYICIASFCFPGALAGLAASFLPFVS